MRYRALSSSSDYTFGRGINNFLVDTPACVGQSVLTRLRLWQNEWFLDVTSGTPWLQSILGKGTEPLYDIVIRQRILDTQGVTGIMNYQSNLNRAARTLALSMDINTVFGRLALTTVLQVR